MTNLFLKVNKDLMNIGLNPTEILIVAQIMEYQTNTNNCFISNKKLAEQFCVSESTIKRALDNLEKLGFINRDTKASQKGKDRTMSVNINKIEEAAKAKMNLANNDNEESAKFKMNLAEGSKCSLRKEQNEPIKDKNEKINQKDNFNVVVSANAETPTIEKPVAKKPEEIEYLKVKKAELEAMGARYELVVGNLGYIIDTGVRIELI